MGEPKGVEPCGFSESELTVAIAGLTLAGYQAVDIERDANSFHCQSITVQLPQWRRGQSVTDTPLQFRDYREWIDWEFARITQMREREARLMARELEQQREGGAG